MTRFLRALTAVAFLFLSDPALSAGQEDRSTSTPGASAADDVKDAKVLMRVGRFEDALRVLRPMTRSGTVDAAVLFHIGLAAMGASLRPGISEELRDTLLEEAIVALHTMLVAQPRLVRVRLELARAFFLKGEDKLATRHFEQVLASKPPAGVALNVNRFLNIMRARKRWSLNLGMALASDTNIGAGSDERIIYIDIGGQRLPFRRDQEELTSSGIGVSAWLGGEYQYPLGDPGTGSGASQWRLRAGGNLSRKEYRESRFDQMTLTGHVGPRWLIGRGSEASLLLSGLHHWTGSGIEEPSHHDIGFRVEGRHRMSPRTTVNARLSWHRRKYDKQDHRDGPITDISVGAGWLASPTVRIDAAGGWGRERTETERWRNSRRWVQLGATAVLPWGFTVGGSSALRWTDYEGNWLPFTTAGQPRSDLVRSIRVFAHNRALSLEGFSPQVSVVKEQRTSNAQLHDYDRIFGELRFVRLF